MKIAIMQPYFIPYIGYWQLIHSVNKMIIYDNIKYTRKGWINRNRLVFSGKIKYVTIPLKKNSDFLDIRDRQISEHWENNLAKILNKINLNYKDSPNFELGYSVVEKIFSFKERNLFLFLYNSITTLSKLLDIKTPLIISSELNIDHSLKSTEKVISICKALKSNIYINPIGGKILYKNSFFKNNNIDLFFLKTKEDRKLQKDDHLFLSIIDLIMFNDLEVVKEYLNQFSLIH